MNRALLLLLVAMLAMPLVPARAGGLSVELHPAAGNPASPRMGDRLSFRSIVRNGGTAPVNGLIAWLSLVRVDKGKEQPIDLEDWSAQKAVSAASLPPGGALRTEWPMRLIQPGTYRVAVSAMSRGGGGLTPSPFVDFRVRPKPVVESRRVLPIALGIPLLIGLAMLWRRRRSRAGPL